jgi:hypothetical protein
MAFISKRHRRRRRQEALNGRLELWTKPAGKQPPVMLCLGPKRMKEINRGQTG